MAVQPSIGLLGLPPERRPLATLRTRQFGGQDSHPEVGQEHEERGTATDDQAAREVAAASPVRVLGPATYC
jgi:hypothetical protein